MTPEFSLRENSDVVPSAESRNQVPPQLSFWLEEFTLEFFGGTWPTNSSVSGFLVRPLDLLISL
jgi:hypothetical protein